MASPIDAISDLRFAAALTPVSIDDPEGVGTVPNIGALRFLFEAAASVIQGGAGAPAPDVAPAPADGSGLPSVPEQLIDIFKGLPSQPPAPVEVTSLPDLFALAGASQDAGVSPVNGLPPIEGAAEPAGNGALALLALAGAVEFLR